MERKLTAILCADVHGYSRLMGEDEEATLRTLTSHRRLIDSQIEQHHGRFVNSAGDSVLAEFASVVEAVNCAVDIQTGLKAENANILPERRMEFRIGVNLGDVMVEGVQIYGDGVNVAARLESLADPGGICISGTVHEQVRDKLALGYEDRGEQTVKNIARPVHVWRVLLNGRVVAPRGTQRVRRGYQPAGALSFAGLATLRWLDRRAIKTSPNRQILAQILVVLIFLLICGYGAMRLYYPGASLLTYFSHSDAGQMRQTIRFAELLSNVVDRAVMNQAASLG